MQLKDKLKLISINLLIFFFLLLFSEIGARIFLSRKQFDELAIFRLAKSVRIIMYSKKFKNNNESGIALKCIDENILKNNQKLIRYLKSKYEIGFQKFVEISKPNNLVIMYLPSDESDIHKNYFKYLAEKNNLIFLDYSQKLRASGDISTWTLMPIDGHLSRYGNYIVGKNLHEFALSFLKNKSPIIEKKVFDPKLVKTTLPKNQIKIWSENISLSYKVFTNSNGFRNRDNINKNSKHVLVYGDSFTFGPYLPNHDTFTEIANRFNSKESSFNNIQFLNAGLNASTIFHEIETLKLSKNLNPDLIILQVLDNDIRGVSYIHMRLTMPIPIKDKGLLNPSKVEYEIVQACKYKKVIKKLNI